MTSNQRRIAGAADEPRSTIAFAYLALLALIGTRAWIVYAFANRPVLLGTGPLARNVELCGQLGSWTLSPTLAKIAPIQLTCLQKIASTSSI